MRTPDPELQERRSREILSAAERCFVAKGFHQTSMQDIAGAAGVSMGLLYRYFENKAALIRAFSEIDRGALIEGLTALAEAPDFLKGLGRLMRAELSAQMAPAALRLSTEVLSEACRDESLRESFAASERRLVSVLTEVLEQQQKAGRVDAGLTPRCAALSILALVEGLAVRGFMDRRIGRKAADAVLCEGLGRLLAPERGGESR